MDMNTYMSLCMKIHKNILIKIYMNIQIRILINIYIVSLRQEQNPIISFAVPFLKMLALCMLWRAQFLSDFYAVFCVYQILILSPL